MIIDKKGVMAKKLKKLKPINTEDGQTVFQINADEASSDPIRAGRLVNLAKKGDKKAAKKLDKMKKAPMYREEQ